MVLLVRKRESLPLTTFFIPSSVIYGIYVLHTLIYVLHYNISHDSLTDKDANILMNCQQYFVPFPYQKRKNVTEEISTRGAQQILTKEYQRLDIVFPPYTYILSTKIYTSRGSISHSSKPKNSKSMAFICMPTTTLDFYF